MASGCKNLAGTVEGNGNPILGGESQVLVTIDEALLARKTRPLAAWSQNAGLTTVDSHFAAGPNPSGLGTATLVVDSTGSYIQHSTTTSVSSLGGFAYEATTTTCQLQQIPDFLAVMKTGPAAADLDPVCLHAGLALAATNTLQFPRRTVAFRYNTIGALSDTQWIAFVGGPSATGTADFFSSISTGVTVTTDTRYVLRILFLTASSCRFYINDVLVAAVSGTSGTDFPTADDVMAMGSFVINGAAGTSRRIRNRQVITLAT